MIMTREEKEEALKWFIDRKKMNLDDKCQQAEDIAIKALEQEPKTEVVNKIRAEIENHCGLIKENHCKYCSYCNCVMGVREILDVINKYNVESEVKE